MFDNHIDKLSVLTNATDFPQGLMRMATALEAIAASLRKTEAKDQKDHEN